MRTGAFLSIQHPNPEIQIPGEGHPRKVRDLRICRQPIGFAEGQDHKENTDPKSNQPEKSEPEGLELKEENTPEKIKRFQGEISKFQNKWRTFLDKGDPYYNINLRLDNDQCAIREERVI